MGVVTKNNVWGAWLCVALLLIASTPARAQADDYPARPITLLVPFAAGGSSDVVMRLVSKRVSESLKQTIVIDNRPGGAGNVAALAIKNAPKDGYTLMMGHTGTHAINATLYPDLKFDPVKDFTPITPLISFNNILIVNAESAAKSAKALVALAKTKPDGLTYASQGVGSSGHITGEQFKQATGTNILHIPYKGAAPAIQDLLGGQVSMLFDVVPFALSNIRAGKVRALAIATPQRVAVLPDVPTMAEAGVPGMEGGAWFALYAPAGTPKHIIEFINREANQILGTPEFRGRMAAQGVDVPLGSPQDLRAFVQERTETWSRVAKKANIKLEQ